MVVDSHETVQKLFADNGKFLPEHSEHFDLPPIVRDWYCYTSDLGDSLLCLVEGAFSYSERDIRNTWKSLRVLPLERVLPAYRIYAGFLVVDSANGPSEENLTITFC